MSTSKKAFITGITGQDGSYLAEFLLEKGYEVYGLIRYSSAANTKKIDHIKDKIKLYYGDMTDGANLIKPLKEIQPDEIYNLAAQSHVGISNNSSEYTANANGLGALRLLEIVKELGLGNKTRFYQALTSDIFANTDITPQNEETPLYPASPYGCAKLYAYWIARNFREKYNMYVVNGIAFGHESPRRPEVFVTRKITKAAARIKLGLQDRLYLGNLSTQRDWGHSKDYVRGMWLMLQNDKPEDFVLATGKTISIRDFCTEVFKELDIDIEFTGNGITEKGIDSKTGKVLVEVKQEFYRPSEEVLAVGDSSKAKLKLGWEPTYSIKDIIKEMVEADLAEANKERTVILNDN